MSPGRWNDEKQAVVYSAPTIAIAVLETAAHIDDAGLPLNRFLVEIDVPDDVWALHEAAAQLMSDGPALDLLAEELRLAQNALNTITGEFGSDDLLGVIFSSFCIGK